MTNKTKLFGATAGAAALALSAGGVAYASTGAPATHTPTTHATTAQATTTRQSSVDRAWLHRHPVVRRDIARVIRHTVHADLIVHTKKGYVTVEIDKGTITGDKSNVLTLTRPDGPSVTADMTSKTHYFGVKQAKLATGDQAIIVQTGGNALVVASRAPSSTSSTSSSS